MIWLYAESKKVVNSRYLLIVELFAKAAVHRQIFLISFGGLDFTMKLDNRQKDTVNIISIQYDESGDTHSK